MLRRAVLSHAFRARMALTRAAVGRVEGPRLLRRGPGLGLHHGHPPLDLKHGRTAAAHILQPIHREASTLTVMRFLLFRGLRPLFPFIVIHRAGFSKSFLRRAELFSRRRRLVFGRLCAIWWILLPHSHLLFRLFMLF